MIGAPGAALSATGWFAAGGAIGRACGAWSWVAELRNLGGIEPMSAV